MFAAGELFASLAIGAGKTLAGMSTTTEDLFLVRFDASGKLVGGERYGDDKVQQLPALAFDASTGCVYLGRSFRGTLDIGGKKLVNTTDMNARAMFLATANGLATK